MISEGTFFDLDYVKLNQNSDLAYKILVSATDLTLFGDHYVSLNYTLNRYGSISISM